MAAKITTISPQEPLYSLMYRATKDVIKNYTKGSVLEIDEHGTGMPLVFSSLAIKEYGKPGSILLYRVGIHETAKALANNDNEEQPIFKDHVEAFIKSDEMYWTSLALIAFYEEACFSYALTEIYKRLTDGGAIIISNVDKYEKMVTINDFVKKHKKEITITSETDTIVFLQKKEIY